MTTLATSSLLFACGGGSSAMQPGAGGASGASIGAAGATDLDSAGQAPVVNCDERPAESVTLDQPIWQTGFKVTLGTATLKPQTPSCSPGILTVDAQFENRGTQTQDFRARTLLSSAGTDYELPSDQALVNVPGGRMGKSVFTFAVDDTFSLDDSLLSFGGAGRHQAKVPLGKAAPDPLTTLEPQTLPIKGSIVAGNLMFAFDGAEVLADDPWSYSSVAADEVLISLHFSATYSGTWGGGVNIQNGNISLLLPDGTSVAPDNNVNELIQENGATLKGLEVRFAVPSPAAGDYAVDAHGFWGGKANGDSVHAELPFTLPSFPAFGDN